MFFFYHNITKMDINKNVNAKLLISKQPISQKIHEKKILTDNEMKT